MAISPVIRELLPTSPEALDRIYKEQERLLPSLDVPVQTDHVLHGGMYSRTVTLAPGVELVGALIRKATLVITVGEANVLVNENWESIRGYRVFPASAGRKQIFIAKSALIITMVFPTAAKSVKEAEEEFTVESELLLSRRQDCNSVTITGE